MGVLEKFLDVIKINDNDNYDDDFFDDNEYMEDKPKTGLFSRKSGDEKTFDFHDAAEPAPKRSTMRNTRTNTKVTPMRASRKGPVNMEVCVLKPASFDDSREIAEVLLANRTVFLNMEGMDLEVAQRIIDFVCGTCYAIDGSIQQISHYIFLATPSNVDVSGDLTDLLTSSFAVPAIGSAY